MREGWKYISFEEGLEKVAKTSKIASSDYKEKGKYPIVSQEETLISGFWDNFDDVYKIQHPVVIFGDHTRIIKFIDFNFVVGADGVKILSPKSNIAPKFFYYYLRWCNIPSLGYSRHYKLLKELQIPVPPLPEQERIVAELDLLTGIIDKQKAQLQELDTLAQSIFYDMFGDPVENEKGWCTKSLGATCSITDGSHNPPKGHASGDYMMLSSKNVQDGLLTFDEPRYLTKAEFESEHKRTNVKCGDVLLTIVGTIGRCCIFNSPKAVTFQRSVAILKPSSELSNTFLMRQLIAMRGFIENEAKGVAQKGIYLKQLSNIMIIIPPIESQQSFAQKIQSIESQKASINRSIAETQKLFDYTMDKYFG